MTLLALLDQTGTVVNQTGTTVDASRNVTRTVTNVTTPYRLDQLSTQELAQNQAQGAQWRLFLPGETTITAASEFIDADGNHYSVLGTPNRVRRPGQEHHLEVLLTSVSGVDT